MSTTENDHRLIAAGNAFYGSTDGLAIERVRKALAAADAADAEHGIQRVRIDEPVLLARTLCDLNDERWKHLSEGVQADYVEDALVVIETLMEATR
ncbi:hypothetical protein ACX80U_05780 [Arthrobacter sp. TmT3-37]